MGITDKIKDLGLVVQQGVKSTTYATTQTILRLITAFFIALTIALIGQQFFKYEKFGLIFVMIAIGASIFKLLSQWNITKILIFDLFCVLVAMLMRMYILIAP